MKKITTYLLPFLAIFLFSQSAWSQKVGSTSMQFLKVMPCARATAMGDAYSVLASGAEAVFWNPAGVAYVDKGELSLTYLKWIFDTQQGALSFATSLGGFGAVGVQLQYVDFGEIPEALWDSPYKDDIGYPGLTGNTFHPFTYLIGLSYASQITEKFATGLSVKYARESLYDGRSVQAITASGDTTTANTWGNGLLFDFGLNYNTGFRTVRIAASMQNFGANVRYASEASPVSMALRVGIAADLIGNNALLVPSEDNRLGVAFDLFQPNDYAQQAHLGIEYVYAGSVALRAGYKFNYDADGFTAGIGFQQTLAQVQMSFDYSYGALNYNLGNVHRISLGVGF
ncbi:MAG: PorV/PorQ family protein [Ignavibacteria bacterium]|nr:PorV/PorQ family protein [Ignavibacteria bacterium]